MLAPSILKSGGQPWDHLYRIPQTKNHQVTLLDKGQLNTNFFVLSSPF